MKKPKPTTYREFETDRRRFDASGDLLPAPLRPIVPLPGQLSLLDVGQPADGPRQADGRQQQELF